MFRKGMNREYFTVLYFSGLNRACQWLFSTWPLINVDGYCNREFHAGMVLSLSMHFQWHWNVQYACKNHNQNPSGNDVLQCYLNDYTNIWFKWNMSIPWYITQPTKFCQMYFTCAEKVVINMPFIYNHIYNYCAETKLPVCSFLFKWIPVFWTHQGLNTIADDLFTYGIFRFNFSTNVWKLLIYIFIDYIEVCSRGLICNGCIEPGHGLALLFRWQTITCVNVDQCSWSHFLAWMDNESYSVNAAGQYREKHTITITSTQLDRACGNSSVQ